MDHSCLVLLWDAIERFLDNMTAKCIHAESKGVATYSLSDCDDLLRRAMLEAALDQKVAKAIDHERIRLVDDGVNDLILLLDSSNLQFLKHG